MSEATITMKMRGRPVTHAEAAIAVQRLINSHFHNFNSARCSIPVRSDDDDIVASDYVIESTAAVAKLEAERDDFERKGKELCSAYGNALIKIHDLEKKLERMQAPVSDALREAAITACELCAGGNKFVETIPRLEEQRSKDRCKWFHRYADTGEMASICTAFKIHDLIAARTTAPQSKEEPNE